MTGILEELGIEVVERPGDRILVTFEEPDCNGLYGALSMHREDVELPAFVRRELRRKEQTHDAVEVRR